VNVSAPSMVAWARLNVSARSGRVPFHGSAALAATRASSTASAVTHVGGGVCAGGSSSETATVAAGLLCDTVQPAPGSAVRVSDPSGSSAASPTVATVWAAVPVVGTVTVCVPACPAAAKPPLSITVTLTVSGVLGAGVAVTVNDAAAPSVTAGPAAMLISGTAVGGGSSSGAGGSSSATVTAAVPCAAETVQPAPASTVAVILPLGSSAPSFAVATVSVAAPPVGIVTVRLPAVMPQSPVPATVTVTASGAVGAGVAVIVNAAVPPSVMADPAVTEISGTAGGGGVFLGAGSSSSTVTAAVPRAADTV